MRKPKRNVRPKFENTRKTMRKQKRQQKKINRKEHYLKSVTTPGQFVKRPDSPELQTKKNKSTPVRAEKGQQKQQKNKKSFVTPLDMVNEERMKEVKMTEKVKRQMGQRRKDILLQANEEEDKVIHKLERRLGLNKSKNKTKNFASDGLDYLLEICDRSTTEQIVAAEKHLAQVEGDSDFEEDLAAVTGKDIKDKDKKRKKTNDKTLRSDGSSDDEFERNDEFDLSEDENLNDGDDLSDEDISEVSDGSDDEFEGNDEFDLSEDENLNDGDDLSDEDISEESDGSDDEVDDLNDVFGDAPEEKPSKKSEQQKKVKSQEDIKKIFSDEVSHLSNDDDDNGDVDYLSDGSGDAPEEKPSKKSKQEKKIKPQEKPSKKIRIIPQEDIKKVFSDDEVSHLSSDDDDEMLNCENEGKKEKPDVWEDIYGRKRDKEGNVIKEEKGVYIPPHLRNKDASSDKQLMLLKRQIKSVLNKLAGTNLHWASTTLEGLYSLYSRHAVNSTLSQLWLDACVGASSTPDRMVAEHAALVAVLHANVGSEIGAHFLQELSKKFDELMQTPQPVENKILDNLVSCFAYLYSFKIYELTLLYDILTRLQQVLSEKNIDCILVVLRSVGGVLRKDEPIALKEYIHDAQARVLEWDETSTDFSRLKFLLQVLKAVKNNNLAKIPNYDPSYAEHLRKVVRGIIRKGNYITELNIRLEDLLKAEERGKWWVVGSAWEGNLTRAEEKPATKAVASSQWDQKLLELARQQRMNTDVRRSIFCVLMSAEDYMDAFEKLQHLGLKGRQEREIVHVLLSCCLQERIYNPYYAVLAQRLCDFDRKYQLSIQFAVWDKIKELDAMSKQHMTNLAQLLIHLFMAKGLPLSVLKIIKFSELNKKALRFMRQILLAIIMNEDLQSTLEVFYRIAKAPKLHMFRESIRLFIQHFLIKNIGKKSNVLSDEEMGTLKTRASEVEKILTSHESKLRL